VVRIQNEVKAMRFTFLTGDVNWQQYGGKFVSAKQNNGEFDYWYVMDVINWEDATGDKEQGTYNVSLYSVSPSEAGPDSLKDAFACCGMDSDRDTELRADPLVQVEALASCGIYAQLWSENGNNLNKLMRQAREQARMASILYGFYMDRPANRIGTSNWDAQRGNILAGLAR